MSQEDCQWSIHKIYTNNKWDSASTRKTYSPGTRWLDGTTGIDQDKQKKNPKSESFVRRIIQLGGPLTGKKETVKMIGTCVPYRGTHVPTNCFPSIQQTLPPYTTSDQHSISNFWNTFEWWSWQDGLTNLTQWSSSLPVSLLHKLRTFAQAFQRMPYRNKYSSPSSILACLMNLDVNMSQNNKLLCRHTVYLNVR